MEISSTNIRIRVDLTKHHVAQVRTFNYKYLKHFADQLVYLEVEFGDAPSCFLKRKLKLHKRMTALQVWDKGQVVLWAVASLPAGGELCLGTVLLCMHIQNSLNESSESSSLNKGNCAAGHTVACEPQKLLEWLATYAH